MTNFDFFFEDIREAFDWTSGHTGTRIVYVHFARPLRLAVCPLLRLARAASALLAAVSNYRRPAASRHLTCTAARLDRQARLKRVRALRALTTAAAGHPTRREVAQEILNASVPTGLTPDVLWDTINAQGVIADTVFQAIINIEKGIWNVSQPNYQ